MHTLPNLLTYLRLALIPLLVLAFYLGGPNHPEPAAGIFVLAGLTDWLDGFLARRLNQATAFGAFLDPVADKLMVVTVLVLLLHRYPSGWLVAATLIITAREIAISALREWVARQGLKHGLPVSNLGKLKTSTQMLALLLLLLGGAIPGSFLYMTGLVILGLATVLTVWSAVDYLQVLKRLDQA